MNDEPATESSDAPILMRLSSVLHEAETPDDVAIAVLMELNSALATTAAYLLLLTPDGKVRLGYLIESGNIRVLAAEAYQASLDDGLPGRLIRHEPAIVVEDTCNDSRSVGVTTAGSIRSALGVRLTHRRNSLGVLVLLDQTPQRFTAADLPLLQAIARQVGLALYALRGIHDERRYRSQVRSIFSISQSLTTRMSVQELAVELLDRSMTIFASACAALYLVDADQELRLVELRNAHAPAQLQPAMAYLARRAWRDAKTITETLDPHGHMVCVALPLIHSEAVLGTLVLIQPAPGLAVFAAGDWSLLTTFANVAAVAFANLNLIEQLRLRASELERQVVRRTTQLQRSRDLLRVVFDNLADGLLLMDMETHLLTANQAFCKGVLGIDPTSAIGERYEEIFQTIARNAAIRVQQQEDGRVLRTDATGQQSWYDVMRNQIIDPESGEQRIIERWHDVTRQETLYRQVLEQAQYTSLGRLASSMVHEVGNPLQSVRSCIELTLEMPDVPPASLRYLQLGLQELDRITQLLERLRALYRRPDFAWMDVDLNTIVQDICRVIHHQIQRRGIILTQQLDPALPGVRGQPDALRQVLLTLLLNQQTALAEGGIIEISTLADYADEPYVIVQIDSVGVASTQERSALSLDTGEPGTGVYLSRLVIEQHGGRLQTQYSTDGHATTTICLPFQR